MKKKLAGYYLEYLNDFLTIEGYAAYHGWSIRRTEIVVGVGRKCYINLSRK